MAYGKGLLVGLLVLQAAPAFSMEAMIREWRRDRYRQAAPREMRSQPRYNQPGQTELHGATSREACNKMEGTFKRQGRKLRLVRVQPTTNPGAVLQYICVFEGEDAQTGYFDEKRY